MKKLIGIILLILIAVVVYADPPSPLVSGLTNASNVAITGGNISVTNATAANLTVSGAVNATGATWTGLNVGTGTVGNLSSTNITVSGVVNATNATWQGFNVGTGTVGNLTSTNANITAGNVTGLTNLGASNATLTGGTISNATISNATNIFIGDTANAKSTQGITVNQGEADDEASTWKSSDVNHGVTGTTEADTYGVLRKTSSTNGGLLVWGLSDSESSALDLWGIIGHSNPADYVAGVQIRGSKWDGATGRAGLGAAETVLKVYNETTELQSVLGDGKTNFWKTANDGTNYEGLQIDPATAGNMQIIAKTAGTGTDNIDITLTPAGTGLLKNAASVITSGSGTGVTVNHTGAVIQQVYKVTTTYAAYSDSDLTKGIVIATLPAKTRLVAAYADTTVAYAGTDITAATLEVGVTAEGAAEIIAVHDVFAGAVTKGLADADMGTGMTRAAQIQGAYTPSFTGTTAVYATIDATTGAATTLANLTAGSTTFYLITEKLP